MMDNRQIMTRVEEILASMTLEEKAAQMVQVPYAFAGREESLRWAKMGAGSFLHVLGDDAREIQRAAIEQSRLGIPVIFGIDAIHGHGLNDHATIFPTQLAAACSWNTEVARIMGEVTAREVATDGLHWTFSPVLCLGRDTRWGRVNETFGEDPYLAGEMGAAIVRGYQGEDMSDDEHILACAKHYIGYGEAVGARDSCDTEMTYRKLREIFLPPFKKAVDAGVGSIMTAYGSIDGTPFTIDPVTMKDILRGELGFDGFVVTDWDNVNSLVRRQHVCETTEEACVLAANAGNDMIMTSTEFYQAVLSAVRDGQVKEETLDDAVRHILTVKLRMNLFEKPEKTGRPGCFGCEEHLQHAKDAADKSLVLLGNNGVLPLREAKKIAVIGPNADDVRAQYGDWTYFTHPKLNLEHEPVRPYVTVKEGMEAACAARGMTCAYHRGCSVLDGEYEDIAGAVETARDADAIVLVVGDVIAQVGEEKDRAVLELSGRQMALFDAMRALGVPLVTVLVASKPLAVGRAAAQADAFICAFNGGMFGGEAVAKAVFGEINPCGRLAISFPRASGQVPVYYNQLPGWHCQQGKGYCDLPEGPLYAFGEGMGYSAFAYSDLTFDRETLMAGVKVTNMGERTGTETVQVYFNDVVSSVLTPVKQLIAFKQVELAPGESAVVEFALSREDFSLINRKEERVTEPGGFELMIGHSSREQDLLKTSFRL
ncbi:MAG: glycoside hydrolase family 3 C-terminal domain-containing protein [Clostridia bacterium]|nr:glycoside hydrolase family 3 C-terminal domain-containing protein [Clostridia bacterium]